MDRAVAIKLLQANLSGNQLVGERFKREIQKTSSLEHPNVVRTLSSGVLPDGRAYLAMEYNGGRSLAALLRQEGQLPWRRAIDIFLQVASGLAYAHEAGIVHRDVKPSNIMIDIDHDGKERAQILDFGVLQLVDPDGVTDLKLTSTNTSVPGSPPYMSPEQCRQEPADARSDIYALGCSLFETITGTPPFTGDSMLEVMFKHAHEAPPMVPAAVDAPKELRALIARSLRKDPDERQQSMTEFRDNLQLCVQGQTSQEKGWRLPGKSIRLSFATVLVIVLAAILSTGSFALASNSGVAILISTLVSPLPVAQRQKVLEDSGTAFETAGDFDAARLLLLEAARIAPDQDTIELYELRMKAADLGIVSGTAETGEYRTVFDKVVKYSCTGYPYPENADPEQHLRERFKEKNMLPRALKLAVRLRNRIPEISTRFDELFGIALSDLGVNLTMQQMYPQAETILKQAEAIIKRTQPPDYPVIYSRVWDRLGDCYWVQVGTPPNLNVPMINLAKRAYERSFAQRMNCNDSWMKGGGAVQVAMCDFALGNTEAAEGNLKFALNMVREEDAQLSRVDSEFNHMPWLQLSESLNNAGTYLICVNPLASLRLYGIVLDLREKYVHSPDKLVEAYRNVAIANGMVARYSDALVYWNKALACLKENHQENNATSALVWMGGEQIRRTLNLTAEAVPFLQKAIACAQLDSSQDTLIPQCALDYCDLQKRLGKKPPDAKLIEQKIRGHVPLDW